MVLPKIPHPAGCPTTERGLTNMELFQVLRGLNHIRHSNPWDLLWRRTPHIFGFENQQGTQPGAIVLQGMDIPLLNNSCADSLALTQCKSCSLKRASAMHDGDSLANLTASERQKPVGTLQDGCAGGHHFYGALTPICQCSPHPSCTTAVALPRYSRLASHSHTASDSPKNSGHVQPTEECPLNASSGAQRGLPFWALQV